MRLQSVVFASVVAHFGAQEVSLNPTKEPTPSPTSPSNKPTPVPTKGPTKGPTPSPTSPSNKPTPVPTKGPTKGPTPSNKPTPVPTKGPTKEPTKEPIPSPTSTPTGAPTSTLTRSPKPTSTPTKNLTMFPTQSIMPTTSVQIDYHNAPRRKWSVQLDHTYSSQLRKGNAVTLSPDNVLLYITHNNGRLTVLHAHDGSERWSYKPSLNNTQWPISCQSGVYFGEHPKTGEEFAVYAITDTPPDGLQEPTSRIVAITHPYNRVMWISPSFPGTVVGTPVISRSVDTKGLYVFAVRNVNSEGHFSVFLTQEDGAMHYTEAAGATVCDDKLPYAPMTVVPKPWVGEYLGGLSNNNDVMIWTTSDQGGRGAYGYTRAFQVPQSYEPGVGRPMETVRLATVPWNGIARPTLGISGFDLFTVARGSLVSGWIFGAAFTSNPSWISLLQSSSDQTAPIENAAVLSRDGRRLFSSSTSTIFHALDTSKGREVWKRALASTPMVEAKVTPDDLRVYVIEADGAITAMDQVTGDFFYSVTCNIHEASCANQVEAEFDNSDDGMFLYYGDINGKINAIELGTSAIPTIPPADYPSFSPKPSFSPTDEPSSTPRPSWIDDMFPSASPTSSPTDYPSVSPSSHPPSQVPSLDPTRSPFNFDGIQGPTSVAIMHSWVLSAFMVGMGLFIAIL